MKKFYLDNAATTKPYPQVVDAMLPYLTNEFGNPGSKYLLGRNAKEAIETARKQVAELINAEPEQIIFTSSGSEANNMIYKIVENPRGKAIPVTICSAIEHPSIYNVLKAREDEDVMGWVLPVTSQGIVEKRFLKEAIEIIGAATSEIPIVSIMYVNNELGSVNDLEMIARVCKQNGCLFHTDCTQAVTCKPIDVKKIGCDFATISAHKIHGPKGIGALYVRDKSLLGLSLYNKKLYLVNGGENQEFGMRAGTENVPGIVGFGVAAKMYKNSFNERMELVKEHSMLFLKVLRDELGDGFRLNCPETNDHLKILSLTFFGVDSETLLLALDQEGVFVSAGSACSNHESEPSHVLKAIGMSREDTFNTIRVSFSGDESVFDISEAASIIADKVKLLKGISDKVKKIMKEKES